MSQRSQSKITLGPEEPISSDLEEDHLNENLNEFERNILVDEELNINRGKHVHPDFRVGSTRPRHTSRASTSFNVPGNSAVV